MLSPALLALALAAAPAGEPFTIDDLVRLPRVAAPAISADGKLVAFTVSRARDDLSGLASRLWVVPVNGGAPREVPGVGEGVSAPRFSPDGKQLLFLSARGGSTQAWIVPVEGGPPRVVTALPGGVSVAFWAPEGDALLVAADVDPACAGDLSCEARKRADAKGAPLTASRLLFRHWDTWREPLRTHLFLVPAAGGPAVDLTPGDRDVPPHHRGDGGDLAAAADGESVYFVAVTDAVEAISTNGDLHVVPLLGGEPTRLTTNPAWDGSPRPSPDGKRLAWRAQARAGYESDQYRVLVAGPDAANPRDLTSSSGLDVTELAWSGDDRILFLAVEKGRRNVYEVDLPTGRVKRLLEGANLRELSTSRDGRVVAGLVDGFTRPPEVAVLEGGKLRVLTRIAEEALSRFALGSPRAVQVASRDGFQVPGWIVTPPGAAAGEKRPGVVLIHGGPQQAWNDAWHLRWNPMVYAARGWTVVMPNPRGSSGWGEPWKDAVRRNWGGGPYQDILAFTDAAVAGAGVDGNRLCAAGASYGGYMVHFINGQTDRFRCLVAHAGNFNLEAAYYDTEELWFPEWELGLPWERPDVYRTWSPHTYVTAWKTPTLVTHGELDYRVNVAQALSAFTALQRRGVESRLLVFPDEDHWIARPKNSKRFHDVVLRWIGDHLEGPAPSSGNPGNH